MAGRTRSIRRSNLLPAAACLVAAAAAAVRPRLAQGKTSRTGRTPHSAAPASSRALAMAVDAAASQTMHLDFRQRIAERDLLS